MRDGDYSWKGKDGDQFAQIVAHVLEGSNDNQVVIGPLVKPPIGQTGQASSPGERRSYRRPR
jgi:hypothetical protein